MGVARLLPKCRAPIETIVAELLNIGGQYHRYLHQDEFGPTRAERMAALREILDLRLQGLDTTTDAEVIIGAGSPLLLSMKAEAVDPFAFIRAQVDRLHHRFEVALSNLEHRKGPEPRLSLSLLVRQLCDLWCRETGKPITANPVRQGTPAVHNRQLAASFWRLWRRCNRPRRGAPSSRA